ncbi:hypothetical protein ANO11243_080490 [Dothideomycetidae sp. 11243]|nr:hypothetical protein ANO11243_080490 [fungal sp. No.11243]
MPVIDYTQNDPANVIPRGSVDFMFDTTGQAMQFLSLIRSSTGMIISISTLPSGVQLQESSLLRRPEKPQLPFLVRMFLDLADAVSKFRARRWGVHYQYLFLDSNADDLDYLAAAITDRKIAPVVGSRADFRDIEKVRAMCETVYTGKGGLGKAVIEMVQE